MTSPKANTKKMAAKIRALFAKLNDEACTPAEKNAAEAKANELITKYAIAESELAEVDREAIVTEYFYIEGGGGPRVARLRNLAGVVARPHGVFCYYTANCRKPDGTTSLSSDGTPWDNHVVHTSGPRKGRYMKFTRITLVGKPGSVAGVKAMLGSLTAAAMAGAAEISVAPGDPDFIPWDTRAHNTKRVRLAFLEGFTREVSDRLEALNRTRNTETGNSLLPVLASDLARAKASASVDLGPARHTKRANAGEARKAGRAAGSKANLASTSVSGRRALTA